MSEIYNNVARDRVEMVVDIYESADHLREDPDDRSNTHQQLHDTGSVCVKRCGAATVCLVLLCFLLLMVIILMCVQTKLSTDERNQLLTNISNITDQRNQLLTNISNITDQRNQLLTNISSLIQINEEINQEKNKTWAILSGWIYYNCSFYFISTEKKNWTESRRYCEDRTADLIIINSEEEQVFISKLVKSTVASGEMVQEFWMGLTDGKEEGNWRWVDGTKLSLSFWNEKEPNNAGDDGGEDCGVTSGRWNDQKCQTPFKWICEKIVQKCI